MDTKKMKNHTDKGRSDAPDPVSGGDLARAPPSSLSDDRGLSGVGHRAPTANKASGVPTTTKATSTGHDMDTDDVFVAPAPVATITRTARATTRAATAARASAAARAVAEAQMVSLADVLRDPLDGRGSPESRDSSLGPKSQDSSLDRGTKRQADSLSATGCTSDGETRKRRCPPIPTDEEIVGDAAGMSADELASAVREFQRAVRRVADTSKNLEGGESAAKSKPTPSSPPGETGSRVPTARGRGGG